MGSNGEKGFYISDIPSVKEVPDWRSLFIFELVDTVEKFRAVRDHYFSIGCPEIANDTETDSLSLIDANLIGFSFCYESNKTYYVPVGHRIGVNVPIKEALDILFEMLYAAPMVFYFNYRFDGRILRKYGFNPMKVKHFGVDLLIFNLDTNITWPDLKGSSLTHLGIRQQSFEELVVDPKLNISYLSPDMVYEYGGADALCTRLLFLRWKQWYLDHKFIVDLDNEFERTIMYLEEVPIYFNRQNAEELDKSYILIIKDLETRIHEMAKTTFNVSSSDQLIVVLQGLGVPLTKMTKGGKSGKCKIATDEPALSPFVEDYPVVALVMEYRTAVKIRSTYIKPYLDHPQEYVYIKYNTTAANTGRLSSSGESKKVKGTKMFLDTNIQNYPKPEPAYYMPELYNGEGNILGWKFTVMSKKPKCLKGYVEGFNPVNTRRTIMPRQGHLVLSIDYKAEEIVIAANISDDQAFLIPLIDGKDPHMATTVDMFGRENANKENRKIAKACNFACIYLGDEKTLRKKLPDKSISECYEWLQLWNKAHWQYLDHVHRECDKARKCGYVSSSMGRSRRVAFYYNHPNKYWAHAADGYVANVPVQSTAAEIIKYDLIRLFREIYCSASYTGDVYFLNTVHDEVNSSVDADIDKFTRAALETKRIMEDLPFKWKKPLEVDISVGSDWGMLFPFSYKNNEWCPKMEGCTCGECNK